MNKIISILKKTVALALRHKIISIIIIICLLGGGFWTYKSLANNSEATQYVFAEVTKATIVSSVTGTGQTSAQNELDVKPKTSGDLTYISVVGGQTITRGQLIAKIDATTAQEAVVNAQLALDQAKTNLEKMKGVETSLGKLRGVTEKAQDTLNASYESGFNTVTNAFLNLPTIMTGLQSILFDSTFSRSAQNIDYYADSANMYNSSAMQYKQNTYDSHQSARASYDKSFAEFKTTNRTSDKIKIELLINQTYDTIGEISQAIKDAINLIQLYQDEFAKHNMNANATSTTHLSSLSGYVNTTNSYLSSLLSTKTSIETGKENLIQTSYDISDQEKLVADKETALNNANKNLSYCYIYAPFSGVVSVVNVKVGDSVSSGTSLVKIVTNDVIAKVSLNEVDANKVKIGQKVTTTFDAIDGLTLTGAVASIDTVGTVSQGVVSYAVQIDFDTQDSRLKPGMSVSASIINETKLDVLSIPNSAVKSKNDANYVLVPSDATPVQKTVEIGISDDTNTEIISGLSEGDQVVVRTISSTATTSSTNPNSSRNMFVGGAPGR